MKDPEADQFKTAANKGPLLATVLNFMPPSPIIIDRIIATLVCVLEWWTRAAAATMKSFGQLLFA